MRIQPTDASAGLFLFVKKISNLQYIKNTFDNYPANIFIH